MSSNKNNRMSLNTVGITPAVFNGIQYKPILSTPELLNNAFEKQEERKIKAIQQAGTIDVALGEIETKLYNNPEMNKWFGEYKDKVKSQIDEAVRVGDYANAMTTAMKLAGDISKDTELLNRMKASTEYQGKVDEVHKMRMSNIISPDVEEWWLANNQFKYEDEVDANGNVVGYKSYSTLPVPVPTINPIEFTEKSFNLITPKKTDNKTTNVDGTGTRTQTQAVHRQDIINNLDYLFEKIPGAKEALYQKYLVDQYKYDKLNVIEDPTQDDIYRKEQLGKTMYRNGSKQSFEEYVATIMEQNVVATNLSYNYIFGTDDYETNSKKTTTPSNSGSDDDGNLGTGGVDGTPQTSVTAEEQSSNNNQAKQAGDRIAEKAKGYGNTSTNNNTNTNTQRQYAYR